MAIASPRPHMRVPLARASRRALQASSSPAAVCALGLGAAVTYAAFADGAIAPPNEARLQLGIAAVALVGLAAVLFAPRMRVSAPLAGWAGLALLALLAVWTGVSMAWSIAPDGSWEELNRTLEYTLAVSVAVAVGASLPRALERAALAFLVIATAVAVYALGGKAFPGVHVGGLIDLNQTAFFSRLRAPLAYWNALALFCVLAVPLAARAAADAGRSRITRSAALCALVALLTTTALTYSRGGFAVLALAMIVLVALGPDRMRLLLTAVAGAIGAAPALVLGFTRHDLTHDLVPLSQRTDDGLLFAGALVLGCAAAVWLSRALEPQAERLEAVLPRRRALAVAAAAAALALVIGLGALAASDRGIGGTLSHSLSSFKSVKYERQNDPARILQTNSGNRWVWWREAAGAFSDRPLAGWGAGSFALLHHRYRHNGLEVLQPHSVPLQFLAEVGLIGTILFGASLALLALAGGRRVAAGLRAARAGVPPGREQRYAAALAAGAAAWLVHMWFDWDWDIPGVALPFFVCLGLLAARPRGAPGLALVPPRGGPVVGRRLLALALGAALLCAVGASAALPSLAHDHVQAATAASARGDLPEAARQADIARRLDPVSVDALLLEARVSSNRGQVRFASHLLTEAVQRQPSNPNVWLAVARLELVRGDIAAMRAAARRAIALDPVGSLGRFYFAYNDPGVRSATAAGTPLPASPSPAPAGG